MSLIQSFIIEGEFLGTMERPPIFYHEIEGDPVGEAFWCPVCARIWATLFIPGVDTRVHHVACEKHTAEDCKHSMGLHDFPGSILFNWDLDFDELPPWGVLKREFLLYCKRHNIGD